MWWDGKLPRWRRPQLPPKTEEDRKLLKKKIGSVLSKGYLDSDHVHSLVPFFSVPKGNDDVRVVYDGYKSGLNDKQLVPSFPLPNANSLLRLQEPGTWNVDLDVGEHFLNFMMPREILPYVCVDITAVLDPHGKKEPMRKRWNRMMMGFRPSPYAATQGSAIAEEFIRGDSLDPSNLLYWDQVLLNLPGQEDHNPDVAQVCKCNSKLGRVAADLVTYFDDTRGTAPTEASSKLVGRLIASRLNYLGLPDQGKKRLPPSRVPGAWAGVIFKTGCREVRLMVSQECRNKTEDCVNWIALEMRK